MLYQYRYRKIPLFNIASGSITITPTAPTALQFKLTSVVHNLSKSFLSYSGQTEAVAANVCWCLKDTTDMVSSIQLTDGGSFPVTTIPFGQNYARIWRKLGTPLSKYLAHDPLEVLCPSNTAVTSLPAIYAVADPAPKNNFNANVNYLESQSIEVLGTALNQVGNFSRSFTLDAFSESIFAMDKDLYYGRDMYLNIQAGGANRFIFQSTNIADPTAGQGAYAGNLTLSNVFLYLAV